MAGDGRALDAVRAKAGEGTRFVGKVSDTERDRLLGGARALVFPGEEDFGIVPVEAQAAGVPVIAYGVGGAVESVADGRTGVLFGEQSVTGLVLSSALRGSVSTKSWSAGRDGDLAASASARRWPP